MNRCAFIVATAAVALSMTAVPAGADPVVTLGSLLPPGYSADACQGIDRGSALAAVSCGSNSLPGGPSSAIYQLFADGASLQKAFTAVLNGVDWTAATCPGAKSPDPVRLRESDGSTYGSVACGRARTFQTERDGAVVWTRDADKFLGVAWAGYQGQPYPADLFAWVRAQAS